MDERVTRAMNAISYMAKAKAGNAICLRLVPGSSHNST